MITSDDDIDAGERMLHKNWDAICIAIGTDGNWTIVVQLDQHGMDILQPLGVQNLVRSWIKGTGCL